MDDDWISIAEAAEILGVSQDTVRRRADEGAIASRRTRPGSGGWRRVSRASVNSYRKAMESGGEPAAE